jgi:hypothetical protein
MLWQRVRLALLVCSFAALAALPGRVTAGCAPACCTVAVTECVPETCTVMKTCYRTECRQECYTAYRCEYAPEVRTRTYTTCSYQPETHTEVHNHCVCVPCVEQRTVMKPCYTCQPVVHMVCHTEDHGHWECHEEICPPSLCDRIKHCFHHDCCCECPKTRTVRCWVPCPVTVQVPVTRYVRTCTYQPVTVCVTTYRTEVRQEVCNVTCYRSVPVTHTENYTVMVPHTVPYQATRTVAVCVPYQVPVTVTHMVSHTVLQQIPVVEACCCCCP